MIAEEGVCVISGRSSTLEHHWWSSGPSIIQIAFSGFKGIGTDGAFYNFEITKLS